MWWSIDKGRDADASTRDHMAPMMAVSNNQTLVDLFPFLPIKSNIQNNNQSRTEHKTGGVEEAALLPFGREQNGRYRTGRWSASYCLNYTHWMTKTFSCVLLHQLVFDVEVVPSTINTRGKQESRKQNKSNTTHIHAIWYNPDGRGA